MSGKQYAKALKTFDRDAQFTPTEALAKVKGARATVIAMDAVTGPYDFIAVVDGSSLDAIGNLVTESIGVIDGVTRTTTCVAVSIG